MASKTPNLNLILAKNGEFFNTWDQPTNTNFTTIDTVLGDVRDEVIGARASAETLAERLANAMDNDGNPLPTDETVAARVSSVYGGFTAGSVAFALNDRLESGDKEIFNSRQSLSALIDALAWTAAQNKADAVISAPTSYLTFTGAQVKADGSSTRIVANINGYRQVVRTNASTTISGGAGTYYIKLTRTAGGTSYGTSTTGEVGTYAANNLVAKITDSTINFVTQGTKPGDIINVTGPAESFNIGRYVVLATHTEDAALTVNEVAIIGQFPTAGLGGAVQYTLLDPVAPTLSFTNTAHAKSYAPATNIIYIGRATFDGTNVTALVQYRVLAAYSDFTSVSGDFDTTINHNLGYFPKKVSIYGTQASDFTTQLEPLSVAEISGDNTLERSVIVKMTDTTITIKNATAGLFYKDYAGVEKTSGFLYVVVER